MKKKDDDHSALSDELDLLVQKLRWLRLPGMAKLVPAAVLERVAKENVSTIDVVHRLRDEENQSRIKSAVDRRLRDARFREINKVDAFNFDFEPARKTSRAPPLERREVRLPLIRRLISFALGDVAIEPETSASVDRKSVV